MIGGDLYGQDVFAKVKDEMIKICAFDAIPTSHGLTVIDMGI